MAVALEAVVLDMLADRTAWCCWGCLTMKVGRWPPNVYRDGDNILDFSRVKKLQGTVTSDRLSENTKAAHYDQVAMAGGVSVSIFIYGLTPDSQIQRRRRRSDITLANRPLGLAHLSPSQSSTNYYAKCSTE